MTQISASHIAPVAGGFEPQRSFDFGIEIYGIGGAETISLAISQGFFPSGKNEVIPIKYFAEERKVAGQVTFADGQITCVDYVEENVAGLLLEWRKLVHDVESGALGWARDYKKQASVILYAPDGTSPRIFQLDGVWPSEVSGDQLSYENNAALKINMNLVFDLAIPKF